MYILYVFVYQGLPILKVIAIKHTVVLFILVITRYKIVSF